MKKILSSALLFLATGFTTLFAQSLQVRLSNNGPIYLSVDGQNYSQSAGGILSVKDIEAGRHIIEVYRQQVKPNVRVALLKSFTVNTAANTNVICVVDVATGDVNQSTDQLADDNRNTQANTPGTRSDSRDQPSGNTDTRYGRDEDNRNNGGNNNNNNNGDNGYNGRNDQADNQSGRDNNANNNNGRNNNDRNNDGDNNNDRYDRRNHGDRDDRNHDGRYGGRNGGRNDDRRNDAAEEPEMELLTAKDIAAIKASVVKKSTDASKTATLQDAIGDRSFSTEQARTMLRFLKGENARLAFARWAIDGTTDTENFGKLNTEFKLAASKREIKRLASEAMQP